MARMNTKTNWRADLEKIRNTRARADEAAQKAAQRAKRLAEQQTEAENMGILHVVRSMQMTPEQLDDFLHGRRQDVATDDKETEEYEDEQKNEAQE